MNRALLCLYVKFQNLMNSEEGQDLVEYALIVTLVALSATFGMKSLSGGIDKAFYSVSQGLATDI
jgi:pilus assembly protein Flp/PilA